ncbi:MACPF domain-containing protein At4g24290 isoform X1 [Elaeis guineensis]|uniref:MACPF domain-containing protein At4g24290 n=1 Tax=Elaeis guineensis var. tenera TaxID=51953 RepID=A0A6J0PED0_ELAGV|nr:MACPF domain-containing protein At4g24290 [Elaeis guineensis]XP_029118410.1 MACPF domain-containing protein At4g24290 [Elaeis guineensis]
MALKALPLKAAEVAIGSIGLGYDVAADIRLKYCKREIPDPCLIELDQDQVQDVVLPGGLCIPNVPKSIKWDKGERMRFRSDVLSFQQMSEQFNQELSLSGKIPSGLFNNMFDFSCCWQRDAANTKSLAFDGWFITLYTVALSKSQVVLRDHVKQAVPSTWDPAALARFILNFGTHIVVGVKMGGKDVIYVKQQHSSSLQPVEVQEMLKELADRRFLDVNGQYYMNSKEAYGHDKIDIREQRLRFADASPSSSYSVKEDIVKIFKRRGGKDNKDLSHNEWLNTVQSEPDVISMSFLPITSLLNGVPGSGFLSHAINLYLRYKPPIEELHQFLEFQLPRQWAPVYSDLPLGPQRKQQSSSSLQFSLMGPKLYVNTSMVDVGKRPVTGLRLYLEGKRSNRLAIHLQHLSSLPQILQLRVNPDSYYPREPYERKHYEPVQWRHFSHVYTAPIEADDDSSFVTGAQLHVSHHGLKKVLFLRLYFSTVLNAALVKNPEWEGSPNLVQKSGLISTLISTHFSMAAQKPPPRPADVNINSAVYPGGPPVPVQTPKLLKFVDTTEMVRGPQHSPGYWVVSGAKLHLERGKISLRVKYSLLTAMLPDDEL